MPSVWSFVLPFLLLPLGGVLYAAYKLVGYRRKARLVNDTKQSRIESLREGYRRIKGTIVAREKVLRSPLNNTRCVYYRFKVEDRSFTLRGQLLNAFDDYSWQANASETLVYSEPRRYRLALSTAF